MTQGTKLFALNMDLVPMRTILHAEMILKDVRKQDAPLSFPLEDGQTTHFTPKPDTETFSVWVPDTKLGIPVEFQPSIVMGTTEAVKVLFSLRKHFNKFWRD